MMTLQQSDPWLILYYGLTQILRDSNQFEKLMSIQLVKSDSPTKVIKVSQLQDGGSLMKTYIRKNYDMNVPTGYTQELLSTISEDFNINIEFETQYSSISIKGNYEQVLHLSVNDGVYSYKILKLVEKVTQCTGCFRSFQVMDLQQSKSCGHHYCLACLKLYFKMGAQFHCLHYQCNGFLQVHDFQGFSLDRCQNCKTGTKLFTNRCGHTFCDLCLRHTRFCIQNGCHFILDPQLVQKLQNICTLCSASEQIQRSICGHYFCYNCIRTKYLISQSSNQQTYTCPTCKCYFDINFFYRQFNYCQKSYSSQRIQRQKTEADESLLLSPIKVQQSSSPKRPPIHRRGLSLSNASKYSSDTRISRYDE